MAPPHSSPPSLLGKLLHRGGVVCELAPPLRLDHIWITEKCKDMNRTAILDSYFGSSILHFGCPCGVGLPPVLVAPHPKWLTQRGAIKRGEGLSGVRTSQTCRPYSLGRCTDLLLERWLRVNCQNRIQIPNSRSEFQIPNSRCDLVSTRFESGHGPFSKFQNTVYLIY